jgi:hypothetical protein
MSGHNLDISMYSFNDVLGLFGITGDVTAQDLLRAKKKVLMTHPDKSRLPADYFIFYKKAYEIIYVFYEDKIKQTKHVPNEKMEYNASNDSTQMKSQINNVMENMKKNEFHNKFNDMFEKNMYVKPDESKNEWFRSESPQYDTNKVKGNISAQFEQFKQQNKIVKYNEVRGLSQGGTNLYQENSEDYIDCDPFSKLKYDDLRKVHKDETIFSVSERDYDNVKKYSSVEQFEKARNSASMEPIEEIKAKQIMERNRKEKEEIIRRQQYEATLKAMENEKKNQTILSNFLRLT